MKNSRSDIDEFLGLKRLAVVGVSRDAKDFSRMLFRELRQRGYDVVPVNPGAREIEGARCFAQIEDVSPPVEGALLMTQPAATGKVVRACAQAGVRRIWMYRAGGTGAVSPEAVEFCSANSMPVVAGECPFMFLPDAGLLHRLHRFCRKLLGRSPE